MNVSTKYLFIFILIFSGQYSISQYSLGGGITAMSGFDDSPTFVGVNGFYEAPRNELQTFFIRAGLFLPKRFFDETNVEAIDFDNPPTPFVKTVDLQRRTTLITLDGGNRMYLYNTYDAGLALYGGINLKGLLATYSERLGEYDETLYQPSDGVMPRSTSLLLSFGGNIGVKYQLPYRGALVFDIGLDLIRRMHDPAFILGNEIAPLSYTINIGYRFDWF